MSYLVLARKWRPQLFDDLVGQEHVSQTLKNAINADRVHHAFLFTGARGVGKTSAARIFAKALNCEKGPTVEPCGVCPSCVEITAGQGVDVFEIDGASNTGVDDIRELRENIRYLPSNSRYKIFIIDEVHMLSINAFNALLKTLEEPPDHAKFIFATTEPHKIPITILSRCQRFDFRKIGQPQVQGRLRYIIDHEKVSISDAGLSMIARSGGGSMRDALSTLDQVIAFCGEKVADKDLQNLLGLVSRRLLLDCIEAILDRDAQRALLLLQKVDEHGHSFRQFCQQLVELVRALVIIKVAEQPGVLLDFSESELQDLRELAHPASLDDLQRLLSALIKAEADLALSNYPRLTLEMVLVKLASLPSSIDVSALVKKLESLERKLAGGLPAPPAHRPQPAAPAPSPAAVDEVSPPPPDTDTFGKKPEAPSAPAGEKSWAGLVEFVKAHRRPRIASLLEQSSLLLIELPRLQIGMSNRYYSLADADMKHSIEELASEYYAAEVRVEFKQVGNQTDAPPSLHQERVQLESDRQRKLRENAAEHPMVKTALEVFGGKIEEIKPIDKGFV
ncbi:DNA polymerase III, tau subunit [Malonomonas rubra DSM 5091]|uniref:DNA polymerase III subunit gamma/tau n=1 Tax=Malonomonas rubra DSM 5091 TaxID=1122189 RepID=A0A1M6LAI9_MALRU|nr:DNA polymerase III subunit gamma/tau [Malonomonas rubra]SHJ68174.1 DNA polymerase III, tau subunit [Malonomonas rubra DSM 5091]